MLCPMYAKSATVRTATLVPFGYTDNQTPSPSTSSSHKLAVRNGLKVTSNCRLFVCLHIVSTASCIVAPASASALVASSGISSARLYSMNAFPN